MVASIGISGNTSVSSFAASQTQGISGVNSAQKITQAPPTEKTQNTTKVDSGKVDSGYNFTPAANISALAPSTANALLGAQSETSGTDQALQQQQQSDPTKPAYAEAGLNITA